LLVRGIRVIDIMTEKDARAHAMTEFARVNGLNVTYPAGDELELPPNQTGKV
jgi:hypothetical protein